MIVLGNRGLCAQPCRLPYELYEENNSKFIDKGYLLSPRDLNGTLFLPELIKAGVASFKIEGRLKSPEYVAEVTRYYRKYIDLVCNNINLSNSEIKELIKKEIFEINDNTSICDTEELTQVFNRGGFSNGHLSNEENKNLIFKDKPNNLGIYIGKIQKINSNKGHLFIELKHNISIGDKISIHDNIYTISELMVKGQNVKTASSGSYVEIGRMRGKLNTNDNIYKIQNKLLFDNLSDSFSHDKEFKKVSINAEIDVLKDKLISINITGCKNTIYENLSCKIESTENPVLAINAPISKEKIITQISKTGNTQFEFSNISINLDDNMFIPKISILNDLRRTALSKLEELAIKKFTRNLNSYPIQIEYKTNKTVSPRISLLLNKIDLSFNYTQLFNIDKLYIPLWFFIEKKYSNIIDNLCKKYNTYIYMPTIIRDNKKFDIFSIINTYKIKGAIISNISQIKQFDNMELIGNYTLNIFNKFSIQELQELGITTFTLSPELNKQETINILNSSNLNSELIVYGKTPLMTNNYCYLGKSNKCYPDCEKLCLNNKNYYLKDRLGYSFRILPNRLYNLTTIYNSKITSVKYNDLPLSNIRIDILDEKVNEIQNIINTVKLGNRFEGNDYTNGKLK